MVKMAITNSALQVNDDNFEGKLEEEHNSPEFEPTEDVQSFVFTELKAVNSVRPEKITASGRSRGMNLVNMAKL